MTAPAATAAPGPTHVPIQRQAPRPAAPAAASSQPERVFQVICHDSRSIVAGTVQSLRAGGCIVSSDQGLSAMPPFRKGTKIWVNLLDEAMDRAENVEATVASVQKSADPERWCYDLDWTVRPGIFENGENQG
jgi:hypothetical protein